MTRIKYILILAIIVVLVALFFNRVMVKDFVLGWQKEELPEAREFRGTSFETEMDSIGPAERGLQNDITPQPSRNSEFETRTSYNLDVPFQSQAPRGDWSMPYQEACEEASLIMADAFYNKTTLTVAEMDERIKKLVDWEVKTFGYYEDTSAAEVARMAKEYFGLNATLDTDVSVDNIKKLISQNKLVIIPAAGKLLPNPNFKNGGPIYHMLIVRGYTADKFITNDPGTRLGKEFLYTYSSLINAIHDWPEGMGKDEVMQAEILQGRKVLIVVSK